MLARRALLLPPALAGGLLLVVLLAELLGRPPAIGPVPLPPAVHAAGIVAEHRENVAAEAATIDARPLFSPDRRPVRAATGAGPARTALRLSAIYVHGDDRRVVFDDGAKGIVARQGGHAGPYTILSIAPDRVTVASPEGTRVLRPTPIPADNAAASSAESNAGPPDGTPPGLSLLQQLQRNSQQNNGGIQNLIARMRAGQPQH